MMPVEVPRRARHILRRQVVDEVAADERSRRRAVPEGPDRMTRADKMSKSRGNVINPDDVVTNTAPTACGCTRCSWARWRP